ncbi:hypothetical protein DY000_02025979 [Brassica cretica]|uniref:Uncharacterized protein n=1 Tax=Brassica cretica TaxID=69181 RepID=A0ABQ7E3Z0_BRACR|nr:hypothetical protein DY000_02025979 [Brassica cretica]
MRPAMCVMLWRPALVLVIQPDIWEEWWHPACVLDMRSDTRAATNLKLIGQSVHLMIKWRCCPELVQIHGFRSVEVLLDTLPRSPKNCPEAKGGSVRVQISLLRPVSFLLVKPRSFQIETSSVQSSQVVPWVLSKSSPINQLLIGKNTLSYNQLIAELFSCRVPLLGSWIMTGGRLANAECLDDIAKLWIVRPVIFSYNQVEVLSKIISVQLEVLLDAPPGSPKNYPEARGGSVRVQISLLRPVSFYMVKPGLCPSQDQSSPVQVPLLGSSIMAGGQVTSRWETFTLGREGTALASGSFIILAVVLIYFMYKPDILEELWCPACVLDMQPDMLSTRCRRACVWSHAKRHTGCHQPEADWLLSPWKGSVQLNINQGNISSDWKSTWLEVNVARERKKVVDLEYGQSVPLMINWRCCPELVQIHGFRSVEVLLDTPPGSPKNCPEAKRGSVRVQISPSRPVSVYMVKTMFCPSRDQSSQL